MFLPTSLPILQDPIGSLAICEDVLVSAAGGRLMQINMRAAVGAASALSSSGGSGMGAAHSHLQAVFHDTAGDVSGAGGGSWAAFDATGGPLPPNQLRVATERVRNTKGLKEKGPIAGLAVLPESRLLAVGFEDGSIRLCF